MNIFVLDDDPILAARFHNDRHVAKQLLEYGRVLATAHVAWGGRLPLLPFTPHHRGATGHPCVAWACGTSGAYNWLYSLTSGLLDEFKARYGRPHVYSPVLAMLAHAPAVAPVHAAGAHPVCMPDIYKVPGDPVASYRGYYFATKGHLAAWTHVGAPLWWQGMEEEERLAIERSA